MKSTLLPLRYFVLLPGLVTLALTSVTFAGNPVSSDLAAGRMQQIRANQVTHTVGTVDMLKAQEQASTMSREKSMSDVSLSWNQLGPNNAAGRTRTVLFTTRMPAARRSSPAEWPGASGNPGTLG